MSFSIAYYFVQFISCHYDANFNTLFKLENDSLLSKSIRLNTYYNKMHLKQFPGLVKKNHWVLCLYCKIIKNEQNQSRNILWIWRNYVMQKKPWSILLFVTKLYFYSPELYFEGLWYAELLSPTCLHNWFAAGTFEIKTYINYRVY